jgi:hypothetical protein
VPDPKLVEVDEIYKQIITGESNIKMIAQYRLEQEMTRRRMSAMGEKRCLLHALRNKVNEEVKLAQLVASYKYSLNKSYQVVVENSNENPFSQYENYTRQPEMINQE